MQAALSVPQFLTFQLGVMIFDYVKSIVKEQ